MKRLMGAVAIAAALFSFQPVVAGGQNPLAPWRGQGDIQDPVEQQSPDWKYPDNAYNIWQCTHDGTYEEYQAGGGVVTADNCVHNPTRADNPPCIWDADDHWYVEEVGMLDRGLAVTFHLCRIDDSSWNCCNQSTFEFEVSAPGNTITVTGYDTLGHIWNPTPVPSDNRLLWTVCQYDDYIGPFDPIANSNGGYGKRVDAYVTITANRKTNAVGIMAQTWVWLRDFTSTTCPNPNWPGH